MNYILRLIFFSFQTNFCFQSIRKPLCEEKSDRMWQWAENSVTILMTSYWRGWRPKSPAIIYSTVCSGAKQRKHQSSASMVFVRGIHRWPVNSPQKGPVTRKMFPFDDVIMSSTCYPMLCKLAWSASKSSCNNSFSKCVLLPDQFFCDDVLLWINDIIDGSWLSQRLWTLYLNRQDID